VDAARVQPPQEALPHPQAPVRILAAAVPSQLQVAASAEPAPAAIASGAIPASTPSAVASLQGPGVGLGDGTLVARSTSSAGSASASAHAAATSAPGATPVAYLDAPPPAYPESARRDGLQGLAVIEVLVSKTGTPLEIRVAKTSGVAALDGAAVDGVRKWRFTPATRDREPIDARITIPIRFRLDGES
jgi:protein TonB